MHLIPTFLTVSLHVLLIRDGHSQDATLYSRDARVFWPLGGATGECSLAAGASRYAKTVECNMENILFA